MSNAERELADLIGICEFCKTILCISKIFNAVFNKKSRRVSMKFFINACTGENQLFKKECHLLSDKLESMEICLTVNDTFFVQITL